MVLKTIPLFVSVNTSLKGKFPFDVTKHPLFGYTKVQFVCLTLHVKCFFKIKVIQKESSLFLQNQIEIKSMVLLPPFLVIRNNF